jgi:lysozyme
MVRTLALFTCLLVILVGCHSSRMEGYDVHGIDVSHYQSEIDWDKVASDSVNFAFIKASEGVEMKDEYFAVNWTGTKEAGIVRGAYHYFIPTLDPHVQANNFIAAVKLDTGDLPPVLDIEQSNNLSKKQLLGGVRKWLTAIESHYKVRPILYTNQNFYQKYLEDEFDDHLIWIARYGGNTPSTDDQNWLFWQYAADGMVQGVNGDVDLNVFQGTLEHLQSLCFNATPPI